MTLQPRHLILAALLHVILGVFLFVGVECSQPMETTPVVQGVLIDPNDLKNLKPPTPPTPQAKPDDTDEGPQQIVKDTDVVSDTAKQKQEQAAAEQKKLDDQKAEQQKQADAKAAEEKQQEETAKAEELKKQQEAQKQADEQAAALKKQQEEDKRKADAAVAAAAEEQRKKQAEEEIRKEAEKEQQAQAAALANRKKAEEAQRDAERRKRAEALQQSLGVESAQITADVQNQWILQLVAAIEKVWAWPPGTDPNTKAVLKLRLSPTGQVMSADISTPSGSPLFDQSLRQAAVAASPLPLPKDMSAFDPNLNICFSPNQRSCQ